MAFLPAGLLARLLAQVLRAWLFAVAIARGRLAAVLAVQTKPTLKCFDPRSLLFNVRQQSANERVFRVARHRPKVGAFVHPPLDSDFFPVGNP
mgnify:CR=1 FL=1